MPAAAWLSRNRRYGLERLTPTEKYLAAAADGAGRLKSLVCPDASSPQQGRHYAPPIDPPIA